MAYKKFSDFTVFDPPDISDYLVGYRELGGEFRASLQSVTDVVKQFVSPTLPHTLFVNMSGNDSAMGNSESFAFRTIKRAMAKALEISRAIPSDFEKTNGWGTYPNPVNVYVRAGDYVEDNPIYVPPGVTVVGENSRSVTVIPKNKFYDIFWVNNKTSIQGFTFKDYYSPAYAVSYPELGFLNNSKVENYPSTRVSEATAKAAYYYGLNFAKYPVTKSSKGSYLNFNADAGQPIYDPFKIAFLGRYFRTFQDNEIYYTSEELIKQKEFWETRYFNLSSAVERPFVIDLPYIFNCYTTTIPTVSTAYDAGGTIYVNGDLVDGPLRSMTIESCEHFNQGGKGVHVLNNGLVNVIDNSTICCTEGIIASDGGTAIVNGSNCSFGLSGLVSIGRSPKPTMVGTLKTSILSGTNVNIFVVTNLGSPDLSASQRFPKNKNPYVGQVFQIIDQNYTVVSSGINYLSANNSGTYFVVQSASNLRPASFPYKGYECDIVIEKTYSLGNDTSITGKTYIPVVDALNSGSEVLFYVRSSIVASSQTFNDIGTGTTYLSAIIQDGIFGNESKETNRDLVGKILFNSSNQTGNSKFGDNITLNQVEGKINTKTLVSNDIITNSLTAYDSVNIGNVKYNDQQGANPLLNLVKTSDDTIIAMESINNIGSGNNIRSFHARGNQSLKKALSANDVIVRLTAFSYNGVNYPNYGYGGNATIAFRAAGDQSLTNAGGYITLHTTKMETISTTSERMRIADNGFVGINTTNPLSTLHVEGGLLVTENLSVSGNSTFNNLVVTTLSALSAFIDVININKYEISGFNVKGDFEIEGNTGLGVASDSQNRLTIVGNVSSVGDVNVFGDVSVSNKLTSLISYFDNSYVLDLSSYNLSATNISTYNLSATNILIDTLNANTSYFDKLTANNARTLSADSDYIYSKKTETLFLSALSSNLDYVYTNKIVANDLSINNLNIYGLTVSYLSALSADIGTTSSLRVSGGINVRDVIYTSNGSSENWNSTYITVSALSALWGDESGAVSKLYVDGKFLPLSSANSAKWDSVYNNVSSNSAKWDSVYTGVNVNSAKWDSVYNNVSSNSANYTTFNYVHNNFLNLTGGTVTGETKINANLTVYGNLSATGNSYFLNTVYSTTSALSVVNIGNTGPALYVGNNGTGDIASFYDIDMNIEVLHVGGNNGSYPNVGIKTSTPNKDFTVKGELSASSDIWTSGRIMSGGKELSESLIPAITAAITDFTTYTTNLTVSLPNGKTFGRYTDGEIIPAIGKTPKDIIQMSIAEPIAPVASLTSPTTIAFNQTAISNTLNFSYIIKSLGASVASVSLEWRRNSSGSWTQLSSNTGLITYNHALTDSSFNNQSFNYKYIVTDTFAATVTASLNITPASYVAPTIPAPTIVAASGTTSPETNTTREKGNIDTNISGSITRNSLYVNLNSYQLQYNVDGSGWVDIGTPTTISGSSYTITSTNHNPTASNNANNIAYRIKVIDDFQTTYSSATTITFYNIIFYGSSVSTPTNSTQVRNNLTNRIFTNGSNPFTLNTGTTNTRFTVAMPNTLSISSVIDLDSLNANITNTYINNPFTVDDYYGNAVSYKVYTLQVGTPYSPSHRHQVTR